MYESFFGLTGSPFRLIPDPSFLFIGKGHRDTFAALQVGLAAGARVMVLTGEVGAGKTTLLQALLASVDPAATLTAHVSAAHLDAEMLSERLAEALGLSLRPDPLARREQLLTGLASGPRATLLVIDEAQHLAPGALDLLETLANGTALAPIRFQICLVGQPELRILLNAAQRSGFRELIGVDRHLGPLEQAEIRLYVEHRLHRAGWAGRPEFEDAAFTEIYIFTAGNPRRINLLCNSLLLCACLKKQHSIDAPAVTWAAAAMREDSLQGVPDMLDLGAHFEHRPTLTEAFEPDTPELEAATRREDTPPWSCPSCGGLNASTATSCWNCEAAQPSLDAAPEAPGEAIRAPEDAVTAQLEAVHVDAESAHAADNPASVKAAEPAGETIRTPEDAVRAQPEGAHVDAASAYGADDAAFVRAAEPPVEAIRAPEDAASAQPEGVHVDAASAYGADDAAFVRAAEPPVEAIRAPEDTASAQPEGAHVDAASAYGADDAASVTAAEPPVETIRAPEDAASAQPEGVHVDAAGAYPADDPAFVTAAEPPRETIGAPEDTVTASEAVHVDSTTSAYRADGPASLTMSDGTSREVEAARREPIDAPLAGVVRRQVSAARRRRQAILASAAAVAVALALIAYIFYQQGFDAPLSRSALRDIVANRAKTPAPPAPGPDSLRRSAGSISPASSAESSAQPPSPELASRTPAIDAAAKAPQDGENGSGRVADEVPGAADAAPGHAAPTSAAATGTPTPACSGPALALGLCDAESSSARRQ